MRMQLFSMTALRPRDDQTPALNREEILSLTDKTQTQFPTCPCPDRIKCVKDLPINLSENKGGGLQNAPRPATC